MTEEETKTKEASMEKQISEALNIDETKLSEELVRQPSLFFYYATGWALAAKKRRVIKLQVREVEASLTREFRERMIIENSGLRVTEKMISDYLAEHEKYKEAAIEQIKAEYIEDMLSAGKDAFKQRGQALLELSRNSGDLSANEFSTIKALREELEAREETKQPKRRIRRTRAQMQADELVESAEVANV